MAFDLGPTHAAYWGTLADNPWRLVTAAAGSVVVVAGVGVLLASPVAVLTPAVLALHYAAGVSVAGAGLGAAGHVLSRSSVAAGSIDSRALMRRVAISASVSVAIGALAGPASAAVYGALGSTLATGAVASGLISTAPLLTAEAIDGRWAAIAKTGGGHGAALATALREVLTVASVGAVSGAALGTLAQAVAFSSAAVGGKWGVALLTLAGAQNQAQAASHDASQRNKVQHITTTPLAATLTDLDDAALAAPDNDRAIAAARIREGFALVAATPHVTLINTAGLSAVRLLVIPFVPLQQCSEKRRRCAVSFLSPDPRSLLPTGTAGIVLRLGLSDTRLQTIVSGQVAPLPSTSLTNPDRFAVFPQVRSWVACISIHESRNLNSHAPFNRSRALHVECRGLIYEQHATVEEEARCLVPCYHLPGQHRVHTLQRQSL